MTNDDPQEIVAGSVAAVEVVNEEISAAPTEVEEAVAVSETSEESAVEIVAEEAAAEAE